MVAEIIAGITLCNSAYKAIKECIGNAKDVSQIAGHLDQLIDGKKQIVHLELLYLILYPLNQSLFLLKVV